MPPVRTKEGHRASAGWLAIPSGVWALGLVSLLMDTSSELIHSLLPVFLVSTLGASMVTLGLIEGVAEAAASITKVFSGVLSDYLGRRKLLAVIGYGMAAVVKPLFPLAPMVGWVFAARFIDRIGKGIRGAPRDALVADLAPPHLRGASYGLRQSLDTVGAFAGPLLAIGLMAALANDIRAVFWFAVIPAVLSVAVLIFGVRDPGEEHHAGGEVRPTIQLADLGRFGAAYWLVVLVGAVLTLARFSEAFLVLRALDVGLTAAFVPMVMVAMNVVYAASAYPAGVLADRLDRRTLLAVGLAPLITADIVLALAVDVVQVMVGVALWGLHMGLTQGLLATLVADASPPHQRGSAFGIFNLVSGLVLLAASALAGALWELFGAPATFLAGAGFTTVALLEVLSVRR
jgi:MFS family permease